MEIGIKKSLTGSTYDENLVDVYNDQGSFYTVKHLISDIDDSRNDISLNANQISFINNNNKIQVLINNQDLNLNMSGWGFSKICSILKLSKRFINRCYFDLKDPDLVVLNLNKMFKFKLSNKEITLRTYNDVICGWIMGKYSSYLNSDLFRLTEGLLNFGDYKIQSYIITPEILSLRVLEKKPIIVNNEKMFFGFNLRNSEVGKSKVEIKAILFREVCSNGMIVQNNMFESFSKMHVNIDKKHIDENIMRVIDLYSSKNPQIIKEKIIKLSSEEYTGTEISKVLYHIFYNVTRSRQLPKDIIKNSFDNISDDHYKILSNPDNPLEDHKIVDLKANKWKFINAITDSAKILNMLDRERVEKVAGDVFFGEKKYA